MIKDKKSPATNNVFKTIVRTVVKEEINIAKDDLQRHFDEQLDEKIDNSYRKYRDDVLTGLDQVMGELKTIRQEQTMHQGQHNDLNMLPERMADMEKIHPQGKHAVI